MKHTNIECNDCSDCPFLTIEFDDFAVGAPFSSYCTLAHYKELEDSLIDVYNELPEHVETPEWCPLKTESVTVKLK